MAVPVSLWNTLNYALLVDMEKQILLILGESLTAPAEIEWQELLADHCVVNKATLDEAQSAISGDGADCVLVLDSAMGEEPVDTLAAIHSANSGIPVVFFCADMTAFTAVRLIHAGAAFCFDSRDSIGRLRETLDTVVRQKRLQDKMRQKSKRDSEPWRDFLVGDSKAMETVAETISLVGPRRCTVLITGDTGTGKEMAARAIHMASPRARFPMVAINCSALPENLLEAELFGHTRGAFTGAANLRIGRFEQANQGTIFLDEIGDMPLALQAKLLRVLQDREVQRLGSSENIKLDVRVIAATNVDLQEHVKQGRFRADLFYRLNVVPLRMPSLGDRTTDIPMLVGHFVRRICSSEDLPLKRISPEALCRLCSIPWPGNVRQLENAIEMAVAVSGVRDVLYSKDFGLLESGPRIAPIGALPHYPLPLSGPIHFDTAVSQFQLAILDTALRQSGGNKTVAAERLGIKRTTLIMKMRSLENSGYLQQAV
jgi:DNA-binding NtrC family response regulator